MSEGTISLTVARLADGEYWIPLGRLCPKILFRAQAIRLQKIRISDPSGHRMDQAEAEGSVKFRPKMWDLSEL
jgi:hypothetical protein